MGNKFSTWIFSPRNDSCDYVLMSENEEMKSYCGNPKDVFDVSVDVKPKPVPRIIMITGKKRSGKDEVAKTIIKHFDGHWVHMKFSDPLYRLVMKFAKDVYGIELSLDDVSGISGRDREQQLGENLYLAEKPLSIRWMLQWLGTDMIRNQLRSDSFAYALRKKQSLIQANIVITDCRFPNELFEMKEHTSKHVTVIRVERPGLDSDSHASEHYIDSIPSNIVIKNNGSLEELREKIKCIKI